MAIYDLGDAVTLTTSVADTSGTPTDADMVVTVTAPDGTTSTPDVNHLATGSYAAVVAGDQVGTWFYQWTASGAITAVESGQFTVADPKPQSYATLADLKTWLNRTDNSQDLLFQTAIEAAARAVEQDCGRSFYLDKTASQRIYDPLGRVLPGNGGQLLLIDDIGDDTGLIVEYGNDTAGWTAIDDVQLGPQPLFNRGWPANQLQRPFRAWAMFPQQRVRVTAQWGWPSIPPQIQQATLLSAARLMSRRGSPEGVAGFNDMGVIRVTRYDPDYERLIAPYRVPGF